MGITSYAKVPEGKVDRNPKKRVNPIRYSVIIWKEGKSKVFIQPECFKRLCYGNRELTKIERELVNMFKIGQNGVATE